MLDLTIRLLSKGLTGWCEWTLRRSSIFRCTNDLGDDSLFAWAQLIDVVLKSLILLWRSRLNTIVLLGRVLTIGTLSTVPSLTFWRCRKGWSTLRFLRRNASLHMIRVNSHLHGEIGFFLWLRLIVSPKLSSRSSFSDEISRFIQLHQLLGADRWESRRFGTELFTLESLMHTRMTLSALFSCHSAIRMWVRLIRGYHCWRGTNMTIADGPTNGWWESIFKRCLLDVIDTHTRTEQARHMQTGRWSFRVVTVPPSCCNSIAVSLTSLGHRWLNNSWRPPVDWGLESFGDCLFQERFLTLIFHKCVNLIVN